MKNFLRVFSFFTRRIGWFPFGCHFEESEGMASFDGVFLNFFLEVPFLVLGFSAADSREEDFVLDADSASASATIGIGSCSVTIGAGSSSMTIGGGSSVG